MATKKMSWVEARGLADHLRRLGRADEGVAVATEALTEIAGIAERYRLEAAKWSGVAAHRLTPAVAATARALASESIEFDGASVNVERILRAADAGLSGIRPAGAVAILRGAVARLAAERAQLRAENKRLRKENASLRARTRGAAA